jgi:hypothetical protein
VGVWGLGCNIDRGDFIVIGLGVEGPRGAPTAREVFRHRSNAREDWAQKLRSLASDLEAQIRIAPPDAIVLRSLDWAPRRSEGPTRLRYQVEGALLLTARRHVPVVEGHSGREIGVICGCTKPQIEAEAVAAFGAAARDPGAAALAALVRAGQA